MAKPSTRTPSIPSDKTNPPEPNAAEDYIEVKQKEY
jgi:hypothetical protein